MFSEATARFRNFVHPTRPRKREPLTNGPNPDIYEPPADAGKERGSQLGSHNYLAIDDCGLSWGARCSCDGYHQRANMGIPDRRRFQRHFKARIFGT